MPEMIQAYASVISLDNHVDGEGKTTTLELSVPTEKGDLFITAEIKSVSPTSNLDPFIMIKRPEPVYIEIAPASVKEASLKQAMATSDVEETIDIEPELTD